MNDGFFGVPAEPIVPRAWIYLTSNFNVPNSSTTTETPFTTQGDILFDTHGFKNPDRHGLTIPHGFGGLYRVESRCYFLTNGANHRGIFVRRMPIFGGAFHVSGHFYLHNGGAGIPAPGCMSVTLELADGDYLTQNLYQNAAATLATAFGMYTTYLALFRIGG